MVQVSIRIFLKITPFIFIDRKVKKIFAIFFLFQYIFKYSAYFRSKRIDNFPSIQSIFSY